MEQVKKKKIKKEEKNPQSKTKNHNQLTYPQSGGPLQLGDSNFPKHCSSRILQKPLLKNPNRKKPHNHHYSRLDGIKKYIHSQTFKYFKYIHQNHSSKIPPVCSERNVTPPKTTTAFSSPS